MLSRSPSRYRRTTGDGRAPCGGTSPRIASQTRPMASYTVNERAVLMLAADQRPPVRPRQRLGRGPTKGRGGERVPRVPSLGRIRRMVPRPDRGATDETKARYAFVFGDFRRVHRTGLIACVYRAPSGATRRSSSPRTTSCSASTRRAPRGRDPTPPTPRRPVTDTYHGTVVTDDYRWLEDWSSPEVQAWSETQNLRARATLDGLPGVAVLRDRLTGDPRGGDDDASSARGACRTPLCAAPPAPQAAAVPGRPARSGRTRRREGPARSEYPRRDRHDRDRLVRPVARRPAGGRVALERRQRIRRRPRL